MNDKRPLLISIPVSHYVEKVRWGLDLAGIPFRERGRLPMLHWTSTYPAGGGRTVPVLITADGVFGDSTDILRWAAGRGPTGGRLYPADAADAVLADEERFDAEVGPATRRLAYMALLGDDALLRAQLSAGLPAFDRGFLRATFPAWRAALIRGLALNERAAGRSRERLQRVFDDVGARLSDGRPFLQGDRMTAADITFASLAAPVLLPENHGGTMFGASRVPAGVLRETESWRAHPAGAWALALYGTHRHASS